MTDIETLRSSLVLTRDAIVAATTSGLYRNVAAGHLTKVVHGAYLPSTAWAELTSEQRHLARIVSAHERYGDVGPFSHLSAAAIWGLPIVGARLRQPEVAMGPTTGGRSREGLIRRASTRFVESTVVDGLRVTTLERTLVDLALSQRTSTAVVALDAALHGSDALPQLDHGRLGDERRSAEGLRGTRRADRAFELGDSESESPGETVSRVGAWVLGFPAPRLQTELRDESGSFVARVDFDWLKWGLIGEFDGLGKYLRAGSDPASSIIAEKVREDAIRSLGPRVTRWGWSTATDLRALESVLRRAGLPQRRRFSPTPPEYDRRW